MDRRIGWEGGEETRILGEAGGEGVDDIEKERGDAVKEEAVVEGRWMEHRSVR